ncbi:MAG: HAD-IA family hydrolase, partial [Nitrospirae bacterium]|nr:HAD-IA family hydrolase [Nitrospirota bacterium]
TLGRLGRPLLHLDTVRQYVGDGMTMLLTRALGKHTNLLEEAIGIYTVHQSRNLVVRSHLYPGVRQTLEHFRPLPMAVVTNKTLEFSEPLLEKLGIRPYFGMIIGADAGLPLKPAPDAFRKIMQDLRIAKEHTVVVGDGTTDVLAGRAAGITTCAVTYGFRSEAELRAAGPDHVIHAFPELKTLFTAA